MSGPHEVTPRKVAEFMVRLFDERWGSLDRSRAVREIRDRFGEAFLYRDDNGNWAIDRRVLAEFRELTPDKVWSRGDLRWEPRRADAKGRTVD